MKIKAQNIETERLILIPAAYEVVELMYRGELDKLKVTPAKGWPRQDTLDIVNILVDIMDKNSEPTGYELWIIVKKEDMTAIGDAGFKGEPNEEGEVEIGYGLVEQEWSKGYGYEAASALVNWALAKEEVRAVKADCLIDNSASIRVLEKLSMTESNRNSELIYWKLKK